MSTLAQLLADRVIAALQGDTAPTDGEGGDEGRPLAFASQRSLEAGRGLAWKDMSADERKRKNDRLRKRRVRYRDAVAAQTNPAPNPSRADGDAEDAAEYDEERFRVGLHLLGTIYPMLHRIARAHYQRVARHLTSDLEAGRGFDHGDVASELYLRLARQVAREPERDLAELIEAARWLAETYAGIPDRLPAGAPAQAGWLVSRANLYARVVLRGLYRKFPSLASIEALDTVFANTGGADQFLSHTRADHAPALSGYRFPRPDSFDPTLLVASINSEIQERSLDALTDVLLDDAYRRSDGLFRWSEHFELIYQSLPVEYSPTRPDVGRHLPQIKVRLGQEPTSRIFAGLARNEVREAFAWMPDFVTTAIDRLDNLEVVLGETDTRPHTERYWSPVVHTSLDPNAAAKSVIDALAHVLQEA